MLRALAIAATGAFLAAAPSVASAHRAASAAPASTPPAGTVAQASDLVAGPHVTPSGATAWVEATETDWRLRSVAAGGGEPTTLAGDSWRTYDDYDSGDFSERGIGAVAFDGDRAVIEHTSRSGSRKYFQYTHGSTVSAYSLTTVQTEGQDLASCSVHEDAFNGHRPDQVPLPDARIVTGDGTIAVNLCGKTRYFAADLKAPTATVDQQRGPEAVAGDFAASFGGTTPGALTIASWKNGTPSYDLKPAYQAANISGIALQADGSAAVIARVGDDPAACDGILLWHTPATPAGTVLKTGVCGARPALAGGEIAVVIKDDAPSHARQLTLVRADGTSRQLAWLGAASLPLGAFSPAAGAVTYAVRSCRESWTIARASGEATGPRALLCANLDLQKAKRSGRTLTLRIKLDPAATGTVRVTYRARGKQLRKTFTPDAGTITTKLRLPKWAVGRKGTTAATYLGDPNFIRQSVER